ncbi:COPI associated [Rhizodiscina lignyota]|uniref:COPI associated n=1 Tax=Rhizodiscina lignyota TaxID=1504668 RepID=A0A9P4IQ08_9PEZI|nr:COPI associated [Rhizodiscina lignyota]
MDFSDAFRFANLGVGIFMILGGIAQFFPIQFHTVIVGVYVILFGLEFQIPPQVAKYASFMFSFIGRGIFYVFIGSIILGNNWWTQAAGAIVGIIGVAYIVLEFIPSIEPPANMRDADASWGAEQI